jgi:hypothetical protein
MLNKNRQLRFDLTAALRCSENMQARGELLLGVLNRLFARGGVSVTRPFVRRSDQIDGVIKLDENLYRVDVRWDEKAVVASDFVHVLEGEGNVDAFLSTRTQVAMVDKNPYASYSA